MSVKKATQTATISDGRPFASSSGNELIPFVQQGENVLIEAQLLHQKLRVKSIFANWVRRRIDEFGFQEGVDYFPNLESKRQGRGGHNALSYLLTLDMAKELAMLERSETGRMVRQYFIAAEKRLRGTPTILPASHLFKGLKPRRINDRLLYPYKEILARAGYSTKSSSSGRRARYWMHFVKEGNILYITDELATHLYRQKEIFKNRLVLKSAAPILPFNFAEPIK